MKRYTAGIAREIVDTSRSIVPIHRPVQREECARSDRHCQSTSRVEATHPDCGIFPFAERDQEVGQRVCSTVSNGTDAQRHRQSGVHESGPRDLPQSDGNTSRRRQSLNPTTWKIRSLLSSRTTHPALHQWILETLHQDRHRHQILAVRVTVPRQAHTEGRTVIQT